MSPGTCKHFGSIPGGHLVCAKGHDIRGLVGGEEYGWMRRVPCHDPVHRSTTSLPMLDPVSCDDYCEPTREEVVAYESEITRIMNAVGANKCPGCGEELERRGNQLICRPCEKVIAVI